MNQNTCKILHHNCYQNDKSIITRIETCLPDSSHYVAIYQNDKSIITRIETPAQCDSL